MGDKLPILENGVQQRCQKRPLVTVEPVLLMYFLAHAPIRLILQQYVYSVYAEELGLDDYSFHGHNSECSINSTSANGSLQDLVQTQTSNWLIYNRYMALVPEMILVLILGPLSDRIGRNIICLLPIAGHAVHLFMIIVIMQLKLPVDYIFVAAAVTGLTGGTGAIFMITFVYIADITTHEQRSHRMFILEIAMGTGDAVSQIATGYIIEAFGFAYPLLVLLFLHVINSLYIYFYLPESISPEHMKSHQSDKGILVSVWNDMKAIAKMYSTNDSNNRRWKLITGFIIMLIVVLVLFQHDILILYMLDAPLCFGSVLLGYYGGISYAVQKLAGLVFLLVAKNRLADMTLVLIGSISGIAMQINTALATNEIIMFTGKQSS